MSRKCHICNIGLINEVGGFKIEDKLYHLPTCGDCISKLINKEIISPLGELQWTPDDGYFVNLNKAKFSNTQ